MTSQERKPEELPDEVSAHVISFLFRFQIQAVSPPMGLTILFPCPPGGWGGMGWRGGKGEKGEEALN